MKRQNKGFLIVILILLIGLIFPTTNWVKNNTKTLATQYNSKLSPIILIPGSSATINRFNEMVEKINKQSVRKHSLIKVEVSTDGALHYEGEKLKGDNEPFIVVGFKNNKDGYDNILQQAKWFDIAFNDLQKKYHFNHFKGIGHSNGGLIYTAFLEKYFKKYAEHIKITKLMTIGTPYNFFETSINHETQMLADFIKNRRAIPKNLNVYSVMGTENYTSDGIVPEKSVEAGKYIYQKQVNHFTEITVTGSKAQHSALPQSEEIIDLITRYIMNRPKIKDKEIDNEKENNGD